MYSAIAPASLADRRMDSTDSGVLKIECVVQLHGHACGPVLDADHLEPEGAGAENQALDVSIAGDEGCHSGAVGEPHRGESVG